MNVDGSAKILTNVQTFRDCALPQCKLIIISEYCLGSPVGYIMYFMFCYVVFTSKSVPVANPVVAQLCCFASFGTMFRVFHLVRSTCPGTCRATKTVAAH